ncbi:MAG: uridine kinase [Oscillospiraceae bacterium]|nr:uridine kinase [Oscillospiraceae bacterium]
MTRGADALIGEARALAARQPLVLLALDGRCAAGKTTLANGWGERFGWQVVHMDDFFLRPEQRTPERYATPGGNVDHERFLAEVLLPLRAGRAARYRPFDCAALRLSEEEKTVAPAGVVVVEGAYACHPSLWEQYDLRAFATVGREEQLRRVAARNGAERLAAFRERWIPLEEAYFAAFDVEARCAYRIGAETA